MKENEHKVKRIKLYKAEIGGDIDRRFKIVCTRLGLSLQHVVGRLIEVWTEKQERLSDQDKE